YGVGLAGILPQKPDGDDKKEEKVDYLNLPCPVPYEEIQREALMSLKPELFEGLRFDFTKMLTQKFALSHSVLMGSLEVPSQSADVIKVPTSQYEFGANFLDPKLMLIGRLMTDGRLNARVKCDLTENLALKINAQVVEFDIFLFGDFYCTLFFADGFLFSSLLVSLITLKGCSTLTTRGHRLSSTVSNWKQCVLWGKLYPECYAKFVDGNRDILAWSAKEVRNWI
uniref:Uncharacterized protein n=1 Tax=Aegilops tauschii subsp. strangulata TaxID=200361 RepID=A0A453I720_AEGTS